MGKRYPRAWKKRYQSKRAKIIADRLLGKRRETLFQPGDAWKWQVLKGRQIGMTMFSNLLVNSPRTGFIINGLNGV